MTFTWTFISYFRKDVLVYYSFVRRTYDLHLKLLPHYYYSSYSIFINIHVFICIYSKYVYLHFNFEFVKIELLDIEQLLFEMFLPHIGYESLKYTTRI
jgi:hypothetical protein